MIRRVAAILGGAAILLTAVVPTAQAADPVVISGYDTSLAPAITMTVAVPGDDPAEPLPATAFTVLESGKRRPVQVVGLPGERLQVALTIDTSGSMAGAGLAGAKAAANALLDQLPAKAEVEVIGFGDDPYVASGFTTDRSITRAAIAGLTASGDTALNDAVVLAAGSFGAARRTIVLLTDGRDDGSAATTEEAAAAAKRSGAVVYGVVLDTEESDVDAPTAIAAVSGGIVARAAEPRLLAGIFDRIGTELAGQYQVRFVATGSGSRGFTVRVRTGRTTRSATTRFSVGSITDGGAATALPAPKVPAGTVAPEPSGLAGSTAALIVGGLLVALGIGWLGFALTRREPAEHSQLAGAGSNLTGRRSASVLFRDLRESAAGATERTLSRGARGAGLDRVLEQAGMDVRPGEYLLTVGGIALGLFLLGVLAGGLLLGLMLAVVTAIVAALLVSRRIGKRQEAFADQLEQTLPLLSGSLRAGFSVTQAIDAVARESDSPTADEFRRVVVETRLGRDLDDSLRDLGERVNNPDFLWVVQAIEIHRMVGGDLAEVLDNVFATIRARNAVRRQVRALSGEGRLSAVVLFLLPIVTAMFIQVMNPGYLGALFQSAAGIAMIFFGCLLLGVGAIWTRKIIRVEY
ncbi:MAG: type II secretion system F family protein [Actinomycetes bacterium]